MARRSGLGRGLEALIPPPVSGGDEHDDTLREIPIGSIRANARQPRRNFDEEALDSLTQSVKESGVLQPILVREISPGSFELIAGERRWRAATRAGLGTIPAVVRTVDELRSLEDALVENLHREDLGPIEEALAYQQLQDEFGLTQEQVAKRVGKSRSAVTNAIRLLQLPDDICTLVDTNKMSAGHARALLGVDTAEERVKLATKVVDEGLSVRELEKLIREHLAGGDHVPGKERGSKKSVGDRSTRSAAVLELEEQLSDRLDTRVSVTVGAKERGRITVEFASMTDLDRIYRAIVDGPEASDNATDA